MAIISKQLSCQKYILKINSSRLRRERWNLALPIDEARRNEEIISLADSQVLRWIDELNGIEGADQKAREIKSQIKALRKEPVNAQNKRKMRQLYSDLDNLQYKPDYMCLIIDKEKDYHRAKLMASNTSVCLVRQEELRTPQLYSSQSVCGAR